MFAPGGGRKFFEGELRGSVRSQSFFELRRYFGFRLCAAFGHRDFDLVTFAELCALLHRFVDHHHEAAIAHGKNRGLIWESVNGPCNGNTSASAKGLGHIEGNENALPGATFPHRDEFCFKGFGRRRSHRWKKLVSRIWDSGKFFPKESE